MKGVNTNIISTTIRKNAYMLFGKPNDYDVLNDLVDGVDIALLGEASHGTKEFYQERIAITKHLIKNFGFNAVAIEGDWPDAYKVNEYVKGHLKHTSAKQSLDGFKRFPTWMWCNREVLGFVEWLHYYNHNQKSEDQVGFYGLDLYSLHASMNAVINYLYKVDTAAAERARCRYACFDHFGVSPRNYAYAVNYGAAKSCEHDAIQALHELRSKENEYLLKDGKLAADDFFFAEQNAKLVKNAEQYYRLMFEQEVSTWNMRDRHMVDTLKALDKHLTKQNGKAKIVVWAHNSHVGDARATEMSTRGELNVGQIVREHYGRLAVNIGFTTYTGKVTASTDWDEPGQRFHVRPALPGSYESIMHDAELPAFLLKFDKHNPANESLIDAFYMPRLERAIGVVYRPESERLSHYFLASLPEQFNAVIHIDETEALEPLDLNEHWYKNEEPETYPFGI